MKPIHFFILIFLFLLSFFFSMPYLLGQLNPTGPVILACYVPKQVTGTQPVTRTEMGVFCSPGVDACDDPQIGSFCAYSCHKVQCKSPCQSESTCPRSGGCSDILDSQGKKIGRVVTCTATCTEGCTGVVNTIPLPPPVGPYNEQSCKSNQPFNVYTSTCEDDCDASTEFCDNRIRTCGGCSPKEKKCTDSSQVIAPQQTCKDDCPQGYYCDPNSKCSQCIARPMIPCSLGDRSFNPKLNLCWDDCDSRTHTCSDQCICVPKAKTSSQE